MRDLPEIKSIEDVEKGMEICEEFVFTEENMKTFSDLTRDDAPIHWNSQFARNRGYRDRLVFGLFVGARFSGLLGTKLPGPHTVLHSTKFQMAQPVYVGETILYRVKVEQVVVAVRAVVLSLEAGRPDGEVVLRGTAQCGFLK